MRTFINALHVLTAVLLVGPLITAPFAGRRAIQRRRPDAVWPAVRQVTVFGAASLVIAGLGVLAVLVDDQYDFRDPWIVISSTLYLVALGLVFLYAAPALRKAAKLVEQGVPDGPAQEETAQAGPDEPDAGARPDSGIEQHTKHQLDAITARVAMAGLLVLLVFAAITVLMTTRPFR